MPVLLRKGLRLFENIDTDKIKLERTKVEETTLLEQVLHLRLRRRNAQIKAEDFGLAQGNLIRVDMDPQQPDIQQGNILKLPFQDGEFDEVWAMFVLKYVDKRLPLQVDQKIRETAQKAGIGVQEFTLKRNVSTFLGLKAMGEMLRVLKAGGKARVGSRIYDFKQSEALPTLLTGILQDKIPGLKISGTEVDSNASDHEEKEANIFLEKGGNFSNEKYSTFLQQEYERLIPQEFTQELLLAV
jgi:SAM-dependent methyltransferase